ncbi:MAG: hypothetical protein P8X86_05090, partial [Desulfofustis sp.]
MYNLTIITDWGHIRTIDDDKNPPASLTDQGVYLSSAPAQSGCRNDQVHPQFRPPDLTRDDTAKQRFLQEAQAASALDHPNICTIHEINETDDGR